MHGITRAGGRMRLLPRLLLTGSLALGASPAPAADLVSAFAAELGLEFAATARPVPPQPERLLLAEAETVAAETLGEMRAGFAIGGVLVNFGFDITTTANGLPLQRMTLPSGGSSIAVTDYGTASTSGAGLSQRLESVLGGGATRLVTDIAGQGVAQVLTNRANDQQIQRNAVFNIEITGLRDMLTRQSVADTISTGLAARRVLGR